MAPEDARFQVVRGSRSCGGHAPWLDDLDSCVGVIAPFLWSGAGWRLRYGATNTGTETIISSPVTPDSA